MTAWRLGKLSEVRELYFFLTLPNTLGSYKMSRTNIAKEHTSNNFLDSILLEATLEVVVVE